jgi:hypothetical protein
MPAPRWIVAFCACCALLGACASHGDSPGGAAPSADGGAAWSVGGATDLDGTATTPTASGAVHLTLSATRLRAIDMANAASSGATGSITLGATIAPLAGTFDTVSGALSVSGGGFVLAGNALGGASAIDGTFTGPDGARGSFHVEAASR